MAYVEFILTFEEKPIEEVPVFMVIIEEPEEVIEELVEEPEPEPEVIEEVVEPVPEPEVESSEPLSDEELEDAKSQAPKKGSDGAVEVLPWRPAWQKKASAEEAAAALALPEVVPVEDPVPEVKIKVSEISREGKVKMEFNQELLAPSFDSKRRVL